MTGKELKRARQVKFGYTAKEMAAALEIEGKFPERNIYRWEGLDKVPGPVAVAVRLLMGVQG